MNRHAGRIIGIHQQISLAVILAPDFKMEPADLMEVLGKSGMKLAPDDAEVMLDASNVFRMEEGKNKEKAKLKVVE